MLHTFCIRVNLTRLVKVQVKFYFYSANIEVVAFSIFLTLPHIKFSKILSHGSGIENTL
jgi:hypothetical protein